MYIQAISCNLHKLLEQPERRLTEDFQSSFFYSCLVHIYIFYLEFGILHPNKFYINYCKRSNLKYYTKSNIWKRLGVTRQATCCNTMLWPEFIKENIHQRKNRNTKAVGSQAECNIDNCALSPNSQGTWLVLLINLITDWLTHIQTLL